METLTQFWGTNDNIAPLEIACRAAVMFFIALVLIRISGMRPFGKGNAFDNIITILIGGILSRGVVGATSFISAVIGGLTIILIHKLLAKICLYNNKLEKLINGKTFVLYQNGNFISKNLKHKNITHDDIYEELRTECQLNSLDNIQKVCMEKNGQISFVKKQEKPS